MIVCEDLNSWELYTGSAIGLLIGCTLCYDGIGGQGEHLGVSKFTPSKQMM